MHVQGEARDACGSDVIEMDDSLRTTFTFANNTEGGLGMAGVPHLSGLVKHQGCLRFAMLAALSPTLLGLDHVSGAEAIATHDGFLLFGEGSREP